MSDLNSKISALSSAPWLTELMAAEGIPLINCVFRVDGLEISVCRDAKQRATPVTVGPVNLGCVSKPIVAAIMLEWAHQESFDVTRDLSQESRLQKLVAPGVSLAHLLSHSSGLPYGGPAGSNGGSTGREAAALIAPPGTIYSYSEMGFALAVKVIEILAGSSFRSLAASVLLDRFEPPLDLDSRLPEVPAPDASDGGSFGKDNDLRMSLHDLLRFLSAQVEGDDGGEQYQPLSSCVVRQMRQSGLVPTVGATPIRGYGWQHMISGVYGHPGLGFRSNLYAFIFPPERLVGVIYTPSEYDIFVPILARLGILGTGYGVAHTIQNTNDHVNQILGKTFSNGDFYVTVDIFDEQLLLKMSRRRGQRLSGEAYYQRMRPNLYVGMTPGHILPRLNRRTAVEIIPAPNSCFLRINDVVYAPIDQ